MAERAVVWVDGVQVPGRDMRLAQAALLTPTAALTARAGVLFGLEVTATSPATMAVSVAAGQCAVTVDETAPGGVALCANDAAVTVPIAAADATNPRIDLVVARVYGELTAVGSRRWALEVVQGTPAASPVAPALPANSLLLRAVTVAANASSIASGDISTTLPARTAAAGGITPSRDGTDVAGAVVGQYRDRLDTGMLERWDGTQWRAASRRVGTRVRLYRNAAVSYATGTTYVPWDVTQFLNTEPGLTAISTPTRTVGGQVFVSVKLPAGYYHFDARVSVNSANTSQRAFVELVLSTDNGATWSEFARGADFTIPNTVNPLGLTASSDYDISEGTEVAVRVYNGGSATVSSEVGVFQQFFNMHRISD